MIYDGLCYSSGLLGCLVWFLEMAYYNIATRAKVPKWKAVCYLSFGQGRSITYLAATITRLYLLLV